MNFLLKLLINKNLSENFEIINLIYNIFINLIKEIENIVPRFSRGH